MGVLAEASLRTIKPYALLELIEWDRTVLAAALAALALLDDSHLSYRACTDAQ